MKIRTMHHELTTAEIYRRMATVPGGGLLPHTSMKRYMRDMKHIREGRVTRYVDDIDGKTVIWL